MAEFLATLVAGLAILLTPYLQTIRSSGFILEIGGLITLITLAIITSIYLKKAKQTVLLSCLALIFIARTINLLPPSPLPQLAPAGTKVELLGQVNQRPTQSNKQIQIILSQVKLITNHRLQTYPGNVLVSLPIYSQVNYGDIVRIRGTIPQPRAGDSYTQYLANHHIYAQVQFASSTTLSQHHGNPFITWSIHLQQAIEQSVNHLLPRDDASFLLGVVLGLPEAMSDTFNQALKSTSTTHIVVASGYNLSIIIAVIMKTAPLIGRKKTLILSFIPVVCYVLISGIQPSIIRAAIVAGITAFALLLGRQRQGLATLALAWLIMLLVNPLWLFDPSFQLSFAATLGILLFQPLFDASLHLPLLIRETLTTTLAAQIGVLPIIIGTFQMVSILGLIVNLLILWLIPWVMATGALLILSGLLLPPLAALLTYLVEPSLLYIRSVVTAFAELPFAAVQLQLSWFIILSYILVITWLLHRRRNFYATLD